MAISVSAFWLVLFGGFDGAFGNDIFEVLQCLKTMSHSEYCLEDSNQDYCSENVHWNYTELDILYGFGIHFNGLCINLVIMHEFIPVDSFRIIGLRVCGKLWQTHIHV